MQIIDRETLKSVMDKGTGFTLINVLPEEEYKKEHITGSINVPLKEADFEKKIEDLAGPQNEPVIVYCASVNCPASKVAAKKLEDAGFTQVRAYEGGMKDWKEAGYPVEGRA